MSRSPTTRFPESATSWASPRRSWRVPLAVLVLATVLLLGWWLGRASSAAVESPPLTLGDRQAPAFLADTEPPRLVSGEDPESEELEPTIGADGIARPTLRLLAPEPGVLVTGQVEVRWESAAASPIEAVEIEVDGRQVVRLLGDRTSKTLDMRFFDDGPHTLEVTVYDANRRKGSQTVEIRLRNPSFGLERVHRETPTLANGETLVLDLETRGSGFEPRVDFSALDSGFLDDRVAWEQSGTDRWRMTYTITRGNRRPEGSYWLPVTLVDLEEPSIEDNEMVRVELSNSQPQVGVRRAFEVPCGVYRPDPVPPASAGSPALQRLIGPATASVGQATTLQLSWDGAPGREEVFLRVTADGFRGHFVLHGTCGLEDTIELVPVAASEGLRIAVWPSEGFPVVHRLTVTAGDS